MKFKIDRKTLLWSDLSKEDDTIIIPNNVVKIAQSAFSSCDILKEVKILDTVEVLENFAFYNCRKLEKMTLSNVVKYIGRFAFCECSSIDEIILPNSLKFIDKYAFMGCSKLKKVSLPNSLESIEELLFCECIGLKKIVIPFGIKNISSGVFLNCINLEEISLPESLKSISKYAFAKCHKLKSISLPSSLIDVGPHIFLECNNLEEIRLNNYTNLYEKNLLGTINKLANFYLDINSDEIVISKDKNINVKGIRRINYTELMSKFNCGKNDAIMLSLIIDIDDCQNLGDISLLLPLLVRNDVTKTNYKDIKEKLKNSKDLLRLISKLSKIVPIKSNEVIYYDIFKLAYTLGIFDNNKVNRQRAYEFIVNTFEQNYFDFNNIHGCFESLRINASFNDEWSKFLMNKSNFSRLLEIEKEESGFISRIYNSFGDIKEFSRSNKGSQDCRNVTIKIAKEYLSNVNFEGVNETNIDISEVIARYTREQDSFNEASKIRNIYLKLRKEGKIKDHILAEELKDDIFSQIDERRENILRDVRDILNNLGDIAANEFSYEFLSKYDATNFILGKYCSCCAHLEGVGKGVMTASILHPDCQNLVIRDKENKIIAKSTLYVNKEGGYGIFNNIEINNNIKDEKLKKLIYQKYLKAVNDFVSRYNEINFSNPLKQLNVGMNANDLEAQIKESHLKSKDILKGIDFSDFGSTWAGDWQKEQYVLWKSDNMKKK